MPARKRGVAGKYERLLIAVIVAALMAALVIVVIAATRPAGSQSTRSFDYSLPVASYGLDDAQLATALDKAKDAGATSIFSGAVWWHMTRPDRPDPSTPYDWSGLDRLVNGAEARGMTVRLQLSGTPDWVHPGLKDTVPEFEDRIWYPPVRNSTQLDHWGDFVYDVVSRYKGRVVHYEMWNEPNTDAFWKPAPDPAGYAKLLRKGYNSAKRAYPDASVAFGGLSRNDVGYLRAYYSEAKKYSGAADERYFFDVLDVHPYSSTPGCTSGIQEPISPDRETTEAECVGDYGTIDQNFLGIKDMKAAMDEEGDTGKPIFLGEYGFSTADTFMKAVPEWRRALYLKRAYMLARDLEYVKGMNWFAYQPYGWDGTKWTVGPEWTILKEDLGETMSYRALKQVTGAEREEDAVNLDTPNNCSISGIYRINPTVTGFESPSSWEVYVDGTPQGTTYTQVPIDWDTTKIADGEHTLMVAAYPQEGYHAGSVWPSDVIPVQINNGAEPVTVDSLSTGTSSYFTGSSVTARATLCSKEPIDLEQLVIAVRLEGTDESFDFPLINNYSLGATAQTVTSTRTLSEPGTYTYWVAYHKNGAWHNLTPRKEFTVRVGLSTAEDVR